ncbi:MAG: TAXI family TRAP transporter solute-binding subunit [Oscillospiraceae bacterium]|nr:TAXI family TRAP transporter solute-binding subunit [Oscillospiraceae bacterium]
MKKFMALILTLIMVVSLVACGGGSSSSSSSSGASDPAPATTELTFTTGGETGTYYAFGGVIAQDVTANTDVSVTAISSDGSKANVLLLDSNDAQLAFCQSDVMAYAYNGTSTFAEEGAVDCFSTVAALYMEQIQIVTCNPEIKTVADLKGKKVSVGAAGSGTYFNAIDILGAYGMTESDIVANFQSFGDSTDSLTDGTIDAAFIVAGAPTNAITSLATTKDVYLVNLDSEHIATLLKTSPYYSESIIPGGTYEGLDAETTTVAEGAVVLARDDVSEDAVYAFVSDIYENAANLSHGKAAELDLAFASSVTAVPYHTGAAKYFAEKGYTVATK